MELATESPFLFCSKVALGLVSFTSTRLLSPSSGLVKTRISLRAKFPLFALPGPFCFIDSCASASIRIPVKSFDFDSVVNIHWSSLGLSPVNRNEPSPRGLNTAPFSDLISRSSRTIHSNFSALSKCGFFIQVSKRSGKYSFSHLAKSSVNLSWANCHLANWDLVSSGFKSTSISLRIVVANVVIKR